MMDYDEKCGKCARLALRVERQAFGADNISVFTRWRPGSELVDPRATCIVGNSRLPLSHCPSLFPQKQNEAEEHEGG